jgi:hypothetical protein
MSENPAADDLTPPEPPRRKWLPIGVAANAVVVIHDSTDV